MVGDGNRPEINKWWSPSISYKRVVVATLFRSGKMYNHWQIATKWD